MRKVNTIVILLAAALALAACKRTPVQDGVAVDDASMGADGASASGLGADGSMSGTGFNGDGMSGADGDPLSKRVVYFEYDSSLLSPEGQAIAEAHANYLLSNPGVSLVLEGHADERGTREYNLGLGERRGNAVSEALRANGGSASQIEVVSYGEERPTCTDSNEDCWGRNRRVEIVYTAK